VPVVGVLPFPVAPAEAERQTARVLADVDPKAVITVEKCSPNSLGVYHTGGGIDMTDTTAKVDLLVKAAGEQGVVTVGIGDLGNEIGFGRIRSRVEELLPKGRACGCPCQGGIA